MTREQRDELRRLASTGPRGSNDEGWTARPDGVVDRSGTVVCGDCLPSDARFIAAANPSAVLALLDALDDAEARAEKAERKLAEVVDYATAADAEREALKAEPARKVADIALARCEVEEKRRIDAMKNWKAMREERDAAVARAEKAEAALKDARRAALEGAAEACVARTVATGGAGNLDHEAMACADAIRALAASDHAVEDTDDCLCGACLGGETCAEREDST